MTFLPHPHKVLGGVRVPHHKNTAQAASVEMPPPEEVVLPMLQHIGAPCIPTVKKGDHVYFGQVVGDNESYICAPIHASVSGTVTQISQVMLTGGQMIDAVYIKSDGLMTVDPSISPPPPILAREELFHAARDAGLVGLGGAGFPAHVKLHAPDGLELDTFIVNAAECEPYVTSDHREALENTNNVFEGIRKIKDILQVKQVIVAVEDNKPDVIKKFHEIAKSAEYNRHKEIRILPLHSIYPQGAEKMLIQASTGRKVPAGGLPANVGCLVMNIASVSFLASFMRNGLPLTRKRITLDGSAILNPQNIIVPVGTKISDIVAFAGGYKKEPKKIIMGGPMMGTAIMSDSLPVIKQNNAILAFDDREGSLYTPSSCIRCGRCVKACPMRLIPTKLEKAVEKEDLDALKSYNISACMECGCCSYSCPAGRRLVQAIRLGKFLIKKRGGKL